ncbi:hypothetical protein LXA43DRAFT_50530 [Ganoderma leucocontextum]|nr:hypothetical protein LXA43DRAFT_50530 [Ganoderma leucocontextum]
MDNPCFMTNPMDGEWRLPFDVIFIIMAASRPSTISALMKTCRALYTEGPKHLLCNGVQLDRTVEITRFANFMLTGNPSRFAHLRKLVLGIQLLPGSAVEAHLADLLAHPSLALDTLVLRHSETLLGHGTDPVLRAAFGRLKTVKHLVVLGVQDDSATNINSLPYKLESISIGVQAGIVNILPMLKPFSHTLRTLLVKSQPFVTTLFLVADSGSFHFPHVQTFGIVYHESVPDLLAGLAFAQAFPAITHLKLIPTDLPTTRRRTGLPTGWALDGFTRSRERSQAQRLQHPDGRLPSLSSLVECSGGLLSVYALSLDCTLSTLRLWQDVRVDELPVLRTVLEDTRPRRLCLSIEMRDAGQLFATLRTLQTHPPPACIDLQISLSFWTTLFLKKVMTEFRSSLESLLRPPPRGLVELNLLFDVPSSVEVAEKALTLRDTLVAFMNRASAVAPSLILTCRLSEAADDGDWQWPDLGQADDVDYDFASMPSPTTVTIFNISSPGTKAQIRSIIVPIRAQLVLLSTMLRLCP